MEILKPQFQRYIGIDYSGAQTPDSSLTGLRIYSATPESLPVEVQPPPGRRKYWTRGGIYEWLSVELRNTPPTLVGIDHGFSFPIRYFETHQIPRDWDAFLEDFHRHWPTDTLAYVDFFRNETQVRLGNSRWRRLVEARCGAKSVFHFDVQGSVAKSTHAGLPWLRRLRQDSRLRLHFWPFDGWQPPVGVSVIAEAYPSLWKDGFPTDGRNPDQHDAYTIARWMRKMDSSARLAQYFQPQLGESIKATAGLEGWILGVPGDSE